MGDGYIEYKAGAWFRYRAAVWTCISISGAVLLVVNAGIGAAARDGGFWFAAVAFVGFVRAWRRFNRPVRVRLTSEGVELDFRRGFARRKFTVFTSWHDVAAVATNSRGAERGEVEYPVLVLKTGRKIPITAILNPVRHAPQVVGLFGMVPSDPRFEEKVSEMRRLLTETRNLEWSDEPPAQQAAPDVLSRPTVVES